MRRCHHQGEGTPGTKDGAGMGTTQLHRRLFQGRTDDHHLHAQQSYSPETAATMLKPEGFWIVSPLSPKAEN